jgi:hypothetical protein
MTSLSISLNVDAHPFPDLAPAAEKHGCGLITHLARIPRGMTSGNSAVILAVKMPSGETYIAQTTMALFQSAALAFRTADEMEQAPNN